MTSISPVSDLRNYNSVLEKVAPGYPVFLTVNGRGRYIIRDIADEEEYERTRAALNLMMRLYEGRQSTEAQGHVPGAQIHDMIDHWQPEARREAE